MIRYPEEVLISDAIRIDITADIDTTFEFKQNGDTIVVSSFFDSDHNELDFIQVRNMDYFVNKIWTRNKNEVFDDFKARIASSDLFKAVAAMWNVGARNILVIKAGNEADIPITTTAAKWDYIYTKTKAALEYATQYEFVGLLYSVESKYQLVIDDTQTTETPTITGTTFSISSDTYEMSYIGVELYENAALVDPASYTLFCVNNTIEYPLLNESNTYSIKYYKCWDFMSLLATICSTNNITQSVLSTDENNVTNILNDETLYRRYAWQNIYCKSVINGTTYWVPGNDKYIHVSVVHGYATISSDYNGFVFQDGLGPTIIGLMSILSEDIAVSGRIISAVRVLRSITQSEADTLSQAGFIPIGTTVKSRRGLKDEVRPMADNNMGIIRSEYRQTMLLRLTRRLSYKVKMKLASFVGTHNMSGVTSSIEEVLDNYKSSGIIRRYKYSISRPTNDKNKILVYIQFLPYFSAKVIEISIMAGTN